MKQLLKEKYGLELLQIEKSSVGAGSDTYFATCANGKYVVKYPASNEINHPEAEPELCEYLLEQGIPVCQFLRNKDGHFLTTDDAGRVINVQRFIEGKVYDLNTAPDWLLAESAQMLGMIHAALREADLSKYKDSMRPLIEKDISETRKRLINHAENGAD